MVSSLVAAIVLAPVELKVMTYNIRYGTAADGVNAWPNRREALIGLIKKHDPDVLGVQEALAEQIDELKAALPGHEVLGVGRDDGIRKGEYSAMFTRKTKVGLREGGTQWISTDPTLPGSLGGEAKIPRVFTWGEFFGADKTRILVMNCHLDHQSESARDLGTFLMRKFAERRGLPTIMTGDFNSSQTNSPLKGVTEEIPDVNFQTRSLGFKVSIPKEGPWGTFNAFDPQKVDGDMIDHIVYSKHWELRSVEIDRTLYNGRAPSDHFPVIARLTLAK